MSNFPWVAPPVLEQTIERCIMRASSHAVPNLVAPLLFLNDGTWVRQVSNKELLNKKYLLQDCILKLFWVKTEVSSHIKYIDTNSLHLNLYWPSSFRNDYSKYLGFRLWLFKISLSSFFPGEINPFTLITIRIRLCQFCYIKVSPLVT